MIRSILLAIMLFVVMLAKAQQSFYNPEYTFIYKLDSADAHYAFKYGLRDTTCFFKHKIDSFLTVQPYLNPGIYLLARAKARSINYYLLTVPFGNINTTSYNDVVQIRLYDSLKNEIEDAKVLIENELLEFDTSCKCFETEASYHKNRTIYAQRENDFLFAELTYENTYGSGNNYNYYAQQKPEMSLGYCLVNQPKYLPGDSVKVKAYLLKRNGKPYKKTMRLFLTDNDGQYNVLLAKLKPISRGAFIYQFKIPDSLKVDKYYRLEFVAPNNDILQKTSFKIEEYKLRDNTYSARIEKETLYKGEKVKLFAKATDANDLPVYDAKVRLRIKLITYENFGGHFLYIPNSWHEKMYETYADLDMSGETEIEIPKSIFPPIDMHCVAELSFSNSGGELKSYNFNFKVLQQSEYYSFIVDENILKAIKIKNGEVVKGIAILKGFFGTKILSQDTIQLPFNVKVAPAIDSYMLLDTAGEIIQTLSLKRDLNEEVNMLGLRSRDSIKIDLNNPYGFNVSYQLIKNGKVILRGNGKEFSYVQRDTSFLSYHVFYSFLYADKSIIKEAIFDYKENKLHVQTNLPEYIYPGQTIAVEATVTNNKRKAAKNVNLTVFAQNTQFEELTAPNLKYYGNVEKELLQRGNSNATIYAVYGLKGNLMHCSYQTLLAAGLINQLDYRLRYPNETMIFNRTAIKFKEAELMPYIVADGRPIAYYAVFVDDKPIFREGMERDDLPLLITSGTHKIAIRTATSFYEINNLLFEDSGRYVLSFDTLCNYTAVHKIIATNKLGFSDEENEQFTRYILPFEFLGNENFEDENGKKELLFVQHNKMQNFNNSLYQWEYYDQNNKLNTENDNSNKVDEAQQATFYHQVHYLGPFLNDTVHIYINQKDSFKFKFEPGFRYVFANGKVNRELSDSFYLPFELNFFRWDAKGFEAIYNKSYRLLLAADTTKEIAENDQTIVNDEKCFGAYYYEPTKENNKELTEIVFSNLDQKETIKNLWIFNKNKKDGSYIYGLNDFDFDYIENGIKRVELDSGLYELYFISAQNTIAWYDSIQIKLKGINLLRIDTLDFKDNCNKLLPKLIEVKRLDELYKKRNSFIANYQVNDYVDKIKAGAFPYSKLKFKKAEVAGVVFDAHGNPLNEVIVTLEQYGNIKGISFSNDDGSFVIQNLEPGIYSLRVTRYGSCITILNGIKLVAKRVIHLQVSMKDCGFEISEDGFLKPTIQQRVSIITKERRETEHFKTQEGFGTIRGTIKDSKTKKGIDFVRVVVQNNGITKATTLTDDEGVYELNNLTPGHYTLIAIYAGYGTVNINNINLVPDEDRFIDFTMSNTTLEEVTIRGDKRTLIDRGGIKGSNVSGSGEAMYSVSSRSIEKIAGTTLGVESRSGSMPNFRGARADGTAYYVDGIRVSNEVLLPSNAFGSSRFFANKEQTELPQNSLNTLYQMATDKSINKTRETFRDYAYWVPNLVTNKQGKAWFTITFPDNITKWRNFIVAMNEKLQTNVYEHDIRSFKPLTANLFIPRFAIAGDSILLKSRVINYTHIEMPLQSQFTLRDTLLHKNKLVVKDIQLEKLWLQPIKADTLQLGYQIQTEFNYKDGEKYLLPVLPNGVMLNQFNYYSLNADTTLTFTTDSSAESHLVFINNYSQLVKDEINRLQAYQYGCVEQTTSKLKALLIEKNLCKLLSDSFTKSELVKVCIHKLENFQQANGSWGWFSNSLAEIWLTNYVIETLIDAQKSNLKTYSLNKGIRYLSNVYLKLSISDKIKAMTLFYACNAEFEYNTEIEKIDESKLASFDRMQLTYLKQQMNAPHTIAFIFKGIQKDAGGGIYWKNNYESIYRNQTSATLLAYQILRNEHADSTLLRGIIHYFFNEHVFETGVYRNTLESAQVLQTMAADIAQMESKTFKTDIKINNNLLLENFPIKKHLSPGTTYTIQKSGAKARMFVYKNKLEKAPTKNATHFDIESYFTQDDKKTDTLQVNLLTQLHVNVNVKKNSEFIMIEIPVPSSCNFTNKNISFGQDYSEFYKDRVLLFYRKMQQGNHHFTIWLEPRFEGSFTLLPVVVSNMYDVEITGNNLSKRVLVK